MKISPSEKSGGNVTLVFKTVEENPPSLFTRELVDELERLLGFNQGRLKAGTGVDRAHQSQKGLAIYADMASWGVKFPLSPFVLQLLCHLEITPGQLSGMAWCHINSFAHIFKEYKNKFIDCPLNVPTVPVFLHYFDFQQDKSWLTTRRRRHLFHHITKVDRNADKFVFLPRDPDNMHLDAGWRQFIEEEWKVQIWVPGKHELNCWEKEVIYRIERIRQGNVIFYDM